MFQDITDRKSILWSPWDKPCDFKNDQGTEFWVDHCSSHYFKKRFADQNIKGDFNYIVYFVRASDGYKTRLVCDNDGAIYESQQTDAIYTFIDSLIISKKDD